MYVPRRNVLGLVMGTYRELRWNSNVRRGLNQKQLIFF